MERNEDAGDTLRLLVSNEMSMEVCGGITPEIFCTGS